MLVWVPSGGTGAGGCAQHVPFHPHPQGAPPHAAQQYLRLGPACLRPQQLVPRCQQALLDLMLGTWGRLHQGSRFWGNYLFQRPLHGIKNV